MASANVTAVLDSTADGIIVIDADNRIVLFNRAAEKLFDYVRAEVLGRDVGLLMQSPHREEHAGYVRTLVAGGPCSVLGAEREASAVRKDGTVFPIALRVTELEGSGGRQFVGIVQNVAARKCAEELARRAETMEAVARLASGLVHDVNNFVFAIRGFAEAALGGLPSDRPERDDLGHILRACESVFALARQLHLVGGGGLPCLAPIEMNELLRNAEPLLRQLAGEGSALEFDLQPGAGEMLGDRRQIEQVVVNLVANARDACAQKGLIRLRCLASELTNGSGLRHLPAPPGRYVELSVSDNGAGIAPGTLPRIFEPFFTTKGLGRGSGLGLSTVYTIVQRHRGGIDVESEPGRGSTFRLLFPTA
ncbi:MAG: ATP-binding protein [Planctomycetota bacterium]